MALTIKKSWYDKLVPLSSEERAQILDDVIEECISLGLIRQGETINSKYYILNEDKTGN